MVTRIDIHYAGRPYSIGGRSLPDVRSEIETALAAGRGWLLVNDGEGVARPTQLLIAPGIDIALAVIPDGEQ